MIPLVALLAVGFPPDPAATGVARPLDPAALRARLGLTPAHAATRVAGVTVAVLDSGFAGVGPDRPYLPASAVVVEHYDPDWVGRHGLGDPGFQKPFPPGASHGRVLAQLVWAVTGSAPDGPRFLLLNANGPTLFRRAVRYAVEQRADVILFGGTFEGAGNYDGRGPVNAAVSEAVAAGCLWVNAAGNCGGRVYDGPVALGPRGWVLFPDGTTALRVRHRLDENPLTLTLTWADYREAEDAGTDKDLDLIVEDVGGREVGRSALRQVPPGRAAGDGETANPRERLELPALPAVAAGREYRVRVRAAGGAFGPADRLRLLVSAARTASLPDPATGQPVAPVELLGASRRREVYPPADHPGVVTVGDDGPASAVGPTADGRAKPDVIVAGSVARFSSGEESDGTSNAAAYFAGVAAVLRAERPGLTADHVRRWVAWLDRERAAPRPVVAASPNLARASRYAERVAGDRPGGPVPKVWVSGPWGAYNPAAPLTAAVTAPHAPWRTPTPAELRAVVGP